MKFNNKGFTLLEILGVVVLLGIISGIAVTSVSRYLTKSRNDSFEIMSQSIYEAAQNCQVNGKCGTGRYDVTVLQSEGYLDNLKSPNASKGECSGYVIISENGSSSTEYKDYIYEVSLKCPGVYQGRSKVIKWPKTFY